MKKTIFQWLGMALAVVAVAFSSLTANAQTSSEPIIEFKTTINTQGVDAPAVTILLGGFKQETDYIDIDCGFGTVEHELVPATINTETGGWDGGTSVTCTVTSSGIVKIYGDASNIAVINFEGCYISDLKMAEMPNLYYINLDHNELHQLDLSAYPALQAISVSDNPFDVAPLKIGGNKPNLMLLEMGQTSNLDQSFNLSDYPNLVSFGAMANKGLKTLDPSGCPKLQRLSIDGTNVQTLDLSKNPIITILNISETGINDIDLSNLPYLQQFYADHRSSSVNAHAKLKKLDVSNNKSLVYLFANGNELTDIDLSNNIYLQQLYIGDNNLTSINLDNNTNLINVMLANNKFTFATLPFPGNWNQYDYYQKNMEIAKTVKVGDVLDYSDKVVREGTTTTFAVYYVPEDSAGQVYPLAEEYYTYADGKVTFLQAPEDSVFLAFANDKFPNIQLDKQPLRTDKFKVKTAEDFGKDDLTITVGAPVNLGGTDISMKVGMAGATSDKPKTFYVVDGNGNKTAFTTTTDSLPASPNVNIHAGSNMVYVYVPQDEVVTALGIDNQQLQSINLSLARTLKYLSLTNTGLSEIDLGYNKGLRSLTLTGNNFSTLNIRGVNDTYQKTLLQDINLSNNNLTTVTLNDMGTIHNLNLSNNQLTELSLKDADNMKTLDLSNNKLTEVNANYCTLMTDFNIANNQISSITMPSELSLRRFHCENNSLSFANLPLLPNIEEYVYAPQNVITIPLMSPGVDLQNHNINGQTVYTWKNNDGTTLTEGTDYSIVDGMTRFLDPIIGESVYCEMTNQLFPGLTLTTTKVQAAEMPKNKIASFTTTADGTATMILRAKEPTIICIDWKGANMAVETYSVTEDILTTEIKTYANSNCAIYSYDDNCPLYVLNITGAKLADVDLSNMKNLVLAAVINAGIDSIKLPDTNTLTELKLDYNNFTSIDLSRYAAQLCLLSMNNNQLTTFDATGMTSLFSLSMANNALTSVTLDAPQVWNLELSGNQLESIDLTKMPSLYQLFLSSNRLKAIDLSKNPDLRVLHIDYNRFTYSTLPLPNAKYGSYQYGNQERIDIVPDANGIVDLSSEADVAGTPSTFRWFVDDPWYDEDTGELTGEELYIDEEYNVEDGKTTFHKPISNVVCAILNDKFPNLTILTNPVDITTTLGIDGVTAGNEVAVSASGRWITIKSATPTEANVYTAGGALVGNTKVNGKATLRVPAAGIYVVKSNGTATKIAVD